MEQLGNVILAPNAKAYNIYRLCMLWNTIKTRPLWPNIKTGEMRSFRCQCIGDHLPVIVGHFMAECQQTPVVEVSNISHGDVLC